MEHFNVLNNNFEVLNDKLDYLILANLVNSDESEQDIVSMVDRFINCRYAYHYFNNIQNPCLVGDKTDKSEV